MQPIDPRPIDILDGDFYVDDPYPRYAWLRANDPVQPGTIKPMNTLGRIRAPGKSRD